MTIIKAKKDIYNAGKCFTKDKTYEVQKDCTAESSLMEATTINDLGEKHIIGSLWRDFKIVKSHN